MRHLASGLFAVLSVTTVQAASIYFTGLPANTANGTYNGYVSGTIDGILFDNLVCDDYNGKTYVPSGPLAYRVSVLDTLTYARFALRSGEPVSAGLERYREAALLMAGMEARPALVADYQYAMWRLFTPAAPVFKSSQALLDTVAALVRDSDPDAYAGVYGRLRVYSPAPGYESNQEFLALTGVPEPPSSWFLGGGMALAALSAVIGWARRSRSGAPHRPV